MHKRILLAEDDELTRFMMCEMLDEMNFEYDVCDNGEQATQMVFAMPDDYGLILMDIHMPKKTGVEATNEIRSASADPPRNIHIVAVTADQRWQNSARSREAGFDKVISKPISMTLLQNHIKKVLAA